MTLPTGTAIGSEHIAAIGAILGLALANPALVRAALADPAVTGS